jgi:DNA repair protein RecO (recombination protein O)
MRRSAKVEAVVLRSFRFAEADRVLHLQTRELGRLAAISKGVRKTRSRFAGRLEPLSHVQLVVHQGSGELVTVTGADLVQSFDEVRSDPRRLAVALVGAEAVLRLFPEPAPTPRLFDGLLRFLALAGALTPGAAPADAGSEPLALAFCLKLIALAGWAPQLDACAACGRDAPLIAYSVAAGGAVCDACGGGFALDPATLPVLRELLGRPLGEAADQSPAARRQARRVVAETVAEHTGGRLRTLPVI